MAVASGVYTDFYREHQAKMHTGEIPPPAFDLQLDHFKIGEGGYQIILGSKEPKVPDPTLTDIEATFDIVANPPPSNPPPSAPIFWKHTFIAGEVTRAGSVLTVTCLVPSTDANDNGQGVSPEFFELGIFDVDGNMIAYVTFPKETKTLGVTLQHVVKITL